MSHYRWWGVEHRCSGEERGYPTLHWADEPEVGVGPRRAFECGACGDRYAFHLVRATSPSAPSGGSEGAEAPDLREQIIEVLHRFECDEEPLPHDWREHLPEDEPEFHPNRIDGLVDLFRAAPPGAPDPELCEICGKPGHMLDSCPAAEWGTLAAPDPETDELCAECGGRRCPTCGQGCVDAVEAHP